MVNSTSKTGCNWILWAPLGFSGVLWGSFWDLSRLPIAGFSGRPRERRSIRALAGDISRLSSASNQKKTTLKIRCNNNIGKSKLVDINKFSKERGPDILYGVPYLNTGIFLRCQGAACLLMSQCGRSGNLSKGLLAPPAKQSPVNVHVNHRVHLLQVLLVVADCPFRSNNVPGSSSRTQTAYRAPTVVLPVKVFKKLSVKVFKKQKLYSSCLEMAAQGRRSRYSMVNPMVIEEGGAIRLRTQCFVSAA